MSRRSEGGNMPGYVASEITSFDIGILLHFFLITTQTEQLSVPLKANEMSV